MAQSKVNICFKCGINSADGLYCTNCLIGSDDDDNKDDNKIEDGNEHKEFLAESLKKKQHYNQYESFGNLTLDTVDNAVLVDDPHFVLTLSNLDGYDNDKEGDKLKELKDCIKNGQWENNPILDNIREKLGHVYEVNKNRVIINDIFYGTTNIGYYIVDYLKKGVQKLIKNATEFMNKMKLSFEQFKELIITPPPKSTDGSYAVVKSYHVSCASRKPCKIWECEKEEHNLVGVVLYMKKKVRNKSLMEKAMEKAIENFFGKSKSKVDESQWETEWECNGRRCKIGYIIVKPTKDIKNIPSSFGTRHAKAYKSVFDEEPIDVVGSGFSRVEGTWKWRSGTFNLKNDEWHNTDSNKCQNDYKCKTKSMNEIEAKWIEKAVRNWHDTGNQNTKVDGSIVIFKDQ